MAMEKLISSVMTQRVTIGPNFLKVMANSRRIFENTRLAGVVIKVPLPHGQTLMVTKRLI
jgi:hypothetical protein